jgi:hypothetical protein
MKIIPTYLSFIGIFLFSLADLSAETPEQVVSSYFGKLQNGASNTIAPLMHPDELRKFRETMVPIVETGLKSPQASLFQKFANPEAPSSMRLLTDAEFINIFMEWLEMIQPAMATIIKSATIEPVGHVVEGDLRHVVIRMKVKNTEGVEIEKLNVVTLKDYQGTPKMMMTSEMKGVAESMKRKKTTPTPPKPIE